MLIPQTAVFGRVGCIPASRCAGSIVAYPVCASSAWGEPRVSSHAFSFVLLSTFLFLLCREVGNVCRFTLYQICYFYGSLHAVHTRTITVRRVFKIRTRMTKSPSGDHFSTMHFSHPFSVACFSFRHLFHLKKLMHKLRASFRAEPNDILFFPARQLTPAKWESSRKDKNGAFHEPNSIPSSSSLSFSLAIHLPIL